MSQAKLSPKEFVQECFPPRLAVLWSTDAHEVCQKNNLNFVQLIEPFCRPNTELIVSDVTNHRFYMKNFYLHVSTIEQAVPPNPNITRNIFHNHVSRAVDQFDERSGPQLEIAVKESVLRIPAHAPWFEAFRDDYIRFFPLCDHECLRDFLGCIFVVSTSCSDPVARAKLLIEQQVQQQSNQKYPRWFGPNILKYFVVLDDLSTSSDETKVRAESAFHYFASTYGEANCCLLKINSATGARAGDGEPFLNPWTGFVKDDNPESAEPMSNGSVDEKRDLVDGVPIESHPLAARASPDHRRIDSPVPEIARCLGSEDADRIRTFVVDLINKCLIPYSERQIKSLNELIISKKGIHRTLVNATKKIFGPSGPPKAPQKVSSGTNLSQVVYIGEAVELQNRKAGDLSFMFQMYDQAFQFFQSARRDYYNDQAWNYYAAASEMCALSVFLSPTAGFSHANAKGFPMQYFETAIKSYTDSTKPSHQNVRATLFATEVCKALHLFSDAASFFKNRASEDFDLMYGLFLEQAGYCYLRLPQNPSPRRFAFQMIFAGFRYFKAAQRKLGILTYSHALKVLEGRGWIVAEDHIRMNIVRHSMVLKMFDGVLPQFIPLLSGPTRQTPQQQFSVFRDFVACRQFVHGDKTGFFHLPVIPVQQIRTTIGRIGDTEDPAMVHVVDEQWQSLEENSVTRKGQAVPLFRHQQVVFSSVTDNRHHPVASVGELVTLEIPVQNPLDFPLSLSSIELEYQFEPRDAVPDDSSFVRITCETPELPIDPQQTRQIIFTLEAEHSGSMKVTGIRYILSAKSEVQTEDNAVVSVRGQQLFTLQGWRLNNTKAEKSSRAYAPDRRLETTIISPRGKLVARWENFPKGVLAGQIIRLDLTVENQGRRAVNHLAVAPSLSDCLVFPGSTKEGKMFTLQIPNGVIEAGKKVRVNAIFIAPSSFGPFDLKTLLYYESVPSDEDKDRTQKYRVWRIQHGFEVYPSVALKGSWHSTGSGNRDVLAVLRIAHVNEVQVQTLPFVLVDILSSNAQWRLSNLSSPYSDDATVHSGEERFITLQASQTASDTPGLTSCAVLPDLDAADQNFIKASKRLTNGPVPADLLTLRLLWKVVLQSDGKATSVYGIRSITFPGGSDTVPDYVDLEKEGVKDKFLSVSSLPLEEPLNVDVIDWSVEIPAGDSWSTIGIVPMKLRIVCTAVMMEDAVFNVFVEFRTAVKSFPLGTRKELLVMKPNETKYLDFNYCFMAAGTYNMAEFVSVKATCDAIPELKVPKMQKPSNNQMLSKLSSEAPVK